MSQDTLHSMTKAELIWWIEKNVIRRPARSDLLRYRWDMACRKDQKESEAYFDKYPKINEAAKRVDEIAVEMQTVKDLKQLQQLLVESTRLRDKIKAHHAEWKRLERNKKRTDAIHKLYEKVFEEEHKAAKEIW